jgi:hypothetical protein
VIEKRDSIERLKCKLVKSNGVYIDADSISIGSLSESPPNEFKFSEEDDDYCEAGMVTDLTNYFTSPQQQQIFGEIKILFFQLNEIYMKEQVFIISSLL